MEQMFIPERHEILGNDLATAHFVVARGGKVRFQGSNEWLKFNEEEDMMPDMPNRYVHGMFLEAVDCEGMNLYYEGLENLRRLYNLKSISFKGVKEFDDWCLDRVSGLEYDSLEELNIADTKVTYRGLQALYRIPTLKRLIISDKELDLETNLVVAMLLEIMPNLTIIQGSRGKLEAVKQ